VSKTAAGGAGAARVNRFLALLDVLNHSVLVHDERRPIRKTLIGVEDPILLRDLALKIAEEWKLDSVLLGKNFIGGRAVYADSEDRHVFLLEVGDISLIRLQFRRSTSRECQDVKRQDHVLFAEIVA